MRIEYTTDPLGGISGGQRDLLSRLHRAFTGPFDVAAAERVLGLSRQKTARILCYWASRGWLSRIQRGLYITVPLEALRPSDWREDAWVMAHTLFAPCYIGGWSAAGHWGLTDQVFADVVVFTASRPRSRHRTVKGVNYLLTAVHRAAPWGVSPVWRRGVKVSVSDPEKTLADILDRPVLGGGIKHLSEMILAYFDSEHRDDKALIMCLLKTTNRTICKRLGFILETLSIEAPSVVRVCLDRASSGYSRLDPTIRKRGRLLRRWRLDVNVKIGPRERVR